MTRFTEPGIVCARGLDHIMSHESQFTRKQFLAGFLTAVSAPGFATGFAELAQDSSANPPQEITLEHLKAYEQMLGIEFTDDERKAILNDVRGLRRSYSSLRAAKLENHVPVSTPFVPVGRTDYAGSSNKVEVEGYYSLKLPTSADDIAFLSVAQLASLVRRKLISPTELTNLYLNRLERYGGPLLNVITLTPELARAQAQQATEEIAKGKYRGPLLGIPYGLKDLFAVRGFPTTWGAAPFAEQKLDFDCAVYERLTQAGAVLCAKLSMGALAMNDVWFNGRTKNPWNPAQGSSGSSAGSCSAVAAGLLPFAIGTETQGSIMSPSHRCRVTGLRPTFGRVSRFGAMALSWSMDKAGPIGRTAEDCAIVLSAINGSDYRDSSTRQLPFSWKAERDAAKFFKSLKIGLVQTHTASTKPNYISLLESLGAKLTPVQFTPVPEGIHIDLSVESAAAFDEFTRIDAIDGLKESLWPNMFRTHRFVGAVEYLQAMRLRTRVMEAFEKELDEFDFVVAPDRGGQLLFVTNRTGHPQLLIPNGSTSSNGQEVEQSFSLVGRLFGESLICRAGWLLQQSMRHHEKRPDLSKL